MCVVCEIFANLRHFKPETLHKMELTMKTTKQSVFVDTRANSNDMYRQGPYMPIVI